MRVTCQQCSAKYTISEEKLRHGVVRLKCRQCRSLIVVQPDGTVEMPSPSAGAAARPDAGHGASNGPLYAAAVGAQDERASHAPAQRKSDPGADAALTVPLPSLQELGVDPRAYLQSVGQPVPPAPPDASRPSSAPLPQPPRASVPPPVPQMRSSVSPDGPTQWGAPPVGAAPPSAYVATTDLDDDLVGPPRPAFAAASPGVDLPGASGAADTSYAPAGIKPRSVVPQVLESVWPSVQRNSQIVLTRLQRWVSWAKTQSAHVPLAPYGWGIVGGLFVCGLLLGALLAPDGQPADRPPLDEAKLRRAVLDATTAARACFKGATPALAGQVEIVFSPDGEAEQVKTSGGLVHADELDCIQERFEDIELPPFSGPPVRVSKRVSLSLDR